MKYEIQYDVAVVQNPESNSMVQGTTTRVASVVEYYLYVILRVWIMHIYSKWAGFA